MWRIPCAVAVLVAGALAAFAGEEGSSKNPLASPPLTEPLYGSHELQFDLFGTYAPSGPGQGRWLGNHAWGGGSDLNYFFTRNLGLGLGGEALDGTGSRSSHVSGDFAMTLYARFPLGSSGWAPYAFSSIGGFVTGERGADSYGLNSRHGDGDDVLFEGRVGLGLEYRFTRYIGLFSDGGYTFVDGGRSDFGVVRTGLRFSF